MEKRVVFLKANDNATIEVLYNLIGMPRVQSSSDKGMGIRINHNPNSTNSLYVINNNIFTRGKYQIYGMNLHRGLYVMGNDFYPGLPVDGSGCMKASVFLEESNEECYIVDNKIDGEDSTDINGSPQISLSNFKDRQTRGVLLRNSIGVIAYCNTLRNIGIAFDLHMDCTGDTIVGNRIIKNHVGLMSRGAATTPAVPGKFTDWGDNNFSYGNVFREWSTTGNPYTAISGGTARLVSVDYGNGGVTNAPSGIYFLNSYEDPGLAYRDGSNSQLIIRTNNISGSNVDTSDCGYDRIDSERNIANILYGQNGQFDASQMAMRMTVESEIIDQMIEEALVESEDELYLAVKQYEINKKRISFLSNHPELVTSSSLIEQYVNSEEVQQAIEAAEVDEIKKQLADTIVRRDLATVASLVQVGLMENADILITDQHTENERKMNEIYLNTIASGIDTFTNDQKQYINEVAVQCPLTGGKSVYLARMMQTIYMPESLYEDNCVENRQNEKREKGNKKSDLNFKLLPNPATEYCWLIHPLMESGAKVLLFDLQGIELRAETIHWSSQKHLIGLQGLPQGTYLLKVEDKGKTIYSNKIVKL